MKKSDNLQTLVSGILLASGSSSRFGEPKQLINWRGKYLINHVITEILKSKIDQLFVVLGDHYESILQVIENKNITVIRNINWEEGKSSSIIAGISHLNEKVKGIIFFVADQPFINKEIINKLIDEFQRSRGQIIAPRINGCISNPVLFGKYYFGELSNLSGEEGGKVIIKRSSKVRWIEWYDKKLLLDIDTQKEYKEFLNMD